MGEKKLTVRFSGGARSVTGSNFLVSLGSISFLVDCGLIQGCLHCGVENETPFSYDPKTISALFVTHGHLDHVGRIPKLVKDGFRGKIFSTPPTKEIAFEILEDALGIMTKESIQEGKDPLYEKKDLEEAMRLWETVPYHKKISFPDSLGTIEVSFFDAGHILGSAMVLFSRLGKRALFTGDLGNTPSPLLRDTEAVADVDYLFMESVYGDRNHDSKGLRKDKLKMLIENGIRRGGSVLIPAFSTERTQELLFEFNDLVEGKRLPPISIYLDSPLAIRITAIYKKYKEYFNTSVLETIRRGDNVFDFPGLIVTESTEESKAINSDHRPKVVIASSGMLNGGRVLHHAKHYLPDPKSTVILVGYQSVNTPGRLLEEGAHEVTIMREKIPVRAEIVSINGYSAHKDSDRLLEFAGKFSDKVRETFLILGEPKASFFLAQRIRDTFGRVVSVPESGEVVSVPF